MRNFKKSRIFVKLRKNEIFLNFYIVEVKRHRLAEKKQMGVSRRIANKMKTKSSKLRFAKAMNAPHKVSKIKSFPSKGMRKAMFVV